VGEFGEWGRLRWRVNDEGNPAEWVERKTSKDAEAQVLILVSIWRHNSSRRVHYNPCRLFRRFIDRSYLSYLPLFLRFSLTLLFFFSVEFRHSFLCQFDWASLCCIECIFLMILEYTIFSFLRKRVFAALIESILYIESCNGWKRKTILRKYRNNLNVIKLLRWRMCVDCCHIRVLQGKLCRSLILCQSSYERDRRYRFFHSK
jgi:hypothetical protein